MGYAQSLLQRDVRREETALRKGAKKKGLWGSIGRTLGGLVATLVTGGVAAPWAVGLSAGAGALAGGALGSAGAGKIDKGKFFRGERESLEKQLDPFGEANVVGALKSAVTAGMGQKLELMKSARAAKALDPTMTDEAVKAMSKGKGFDYGESVLGRGIAKGKAAKELGTMRGWQGEYETLLSEATPRPLQYGDQKVSAWDKFKDFVDVSDVKEERAIESQLSQYRGNMSATQVPKKSWQKQMGLYTGYGEEGYRPTTWTGETELQKGFDQYKTFKDTKVGGIPEWRLR